MNACASYNIGQENVTYITAVYDTIIVCNEKRSSGRIYLSRDVSAADGKSNYKASRTAVLVRAT